MISVSSTSIQETLDTPNMTPNEVESKVVDARRKIHSGIVSYRINTYINVDQQNWVNNDRTIDVVFDENSIKSTKKFRNADGPYTETRVLSEDKRILSTSQDVPVMIKARTGATLEEDNQFNPRAVGLVPTGLETLYRYGINELLQRPDRKNISLTKNQQKYLLTFDIQRQEDRWTKVSITISPEEGWSVADIIIDMHKPASDSQYQIKTENVLYAKSNVWYPKTMRFVYTAKNKVQVDETTTIESAEFNSKIPSSEFAIESLNLPTGKRIGYENGLLLQWNGKSPGPIRSTQEITQIANRELSGVRGWSLGVLVIISGCLLLLGIFFLYKFIKVKFAL
jgi:hypothetical protein